MDCQEEGEVKLSLAIGGCVLAVLLASCSSGVGSSEKATNADSQPEETVFSGYVKDLHKAKQVEETLKAAKERLDARLNQMTSFSHSGGE